MFLISVNSISLYESIIFYLNNFTYVTRFVIKTYIDYTVFLKIFMNYFKLFELQVFTLMTNYFTQSIIFTFLIVVFFK
jgi:hypothetical protein